MLHTKIFLLSCNWSYVIIKTDVKNYEFATQYYQVPNISFKHSLINTNVTTKFNTVLSNLPLPVLHIYSKRNYDLAFKFKHLFSSPHKIHFFFQRKQVNDVQKFRSIYTLKVKHYCRLIITRIIIECVRITITTIVKFEIEWRFLL